MQLEKLIEERLNELLQDARRLARTNEYGEAVSGEHLDKCIGWIAAAANIVDAIAPQEKSAYKLAAKKIYEYDWAYEAPRGVGQFASILRNLLKDAKGGLISSVADQARAETFDDFLDHAKAYLKEEKKKESGTIAGVVFEDSLRTVCRKNSIEEKNIKLDTLITTLTKEEILTASKAKRARAAAHVRTKATHAQWDEFDLSDVTSAIKFSEELVLEHLEK